jgi:hypothetical protein
MAEIMIKINDNYNSYERSEYDYKTYLETLLDIINDENYEMNDELYKKYKNALEKAIELGPEKDENSKEIKKKISMLFMIDNGIMPPRNNIIEDNYGEDIFYNDEIDKIKIPLAKLRTYPYYNKLHKILEENENLFNGGSRRNKATPKPKAKPKHEDMTMKDIKEMCKANQIKLSKVVDNKRVVFKKKELITKLKRKKLL